MIATLDLDDDLLYPDSDGKPMAENTEQYDWIVKIKENLEILFADRTDVFIAGDLLWYPVKSTLIAPCAPDIMVALGRPKGRRGSYKQWKENNIAPQVVFEILSPSNTEAEMTRKFEFYQSYGVEEYYVFNPKTQTLKGWVGQNEVLSPILPINGWISPCLRIRFVLTNSGLEIYHPNGQRFLNSIELAQQAEQERQRAEQERQCAEQERQRAERLAQRLRELGIDPEKLE